MNATGGAGREMVRETRSSASMRLLYGCPCPPSTWVAGWGERQSLAYQLGPKRRVDSRSLPMAPQSSPPDTAAGTEARAKQAQAYRSGTRLNPGAPGCGLQRSLRGGGGALRIAGLGLASRAPLYRAIAARPGNHRRCSATRQARDHRRNLLLRAEVGAGELLFRRRHFVGLAAREHDRDALPLLRLPDPLRNLPPVRREAVERD